jgi:DNA-binding response OmpR family regulator
MSRKRSDSVVSKNILVGESSDGDFFMLERAFKAAGQGHRLSRVRDGVEVLAYVVGDAPFGNPQEHPSPDLVIVEALLPGVNGVELLNYLRRELSLQVPVVILSSSLDAEEMRKTTRLGKAEYLMKPLTFRVLLEVVQGIQERWFKAARGA